MGEAIHAHKEGWLGRVCAPQRGGDLSNLGAQARGHNDAKRPSTGHTAQREATYIEGTIRFLPSGARGLLLTGMLAALASTLDTHLNWGASYFANDLCKRLCCQLSRKQTPSERALVWVARGSNLLILALSLIVLSQLRSIQSAWSASLLLGAGMGVPLLLRWLWWRMSAASELAAIAASLVAAPLLHWRVPSDPLRMLIMTLLTAFAAIAVALRWPPQISPELQAFYLRLVPHIGCAEGIGGSA